MTSRPVAIPGLGHALGETIDIVRDTVKDFASTEIAPRAGAIDQANDFPQDLPFPRSTAGPAWVTWPT